LFIGFSFPEEREKDNPPIGGGYSTCGNSRAFAVVMVSPISGWFMNVFL